MRALQGACNVLMLCSAAKRKFFSAPLRPKPVANGRSAQALLRALEPPHSSTPSASPSPSALETHAGIEALDSIAFALESKSGDAWDAREAAACLASIVALGGGRVSVLDAQPPACLRTTRSRRALRLLTLRIYQRWAILPLADSIAAVVALNCAGVTFEPFLKSLMLWSNALANEADALARGSNCGTDEMSRNARLVLERSAQKEGFPSRSLFELEAVPLRLRAALVGVLSQAAADARARGGVANDYLNFIARLIAIDLQGGGGTRLSGEPAQAGVSAVHSAPPFFYDYNWHRSSDSGSGAAPLPLPLWFSVPAADAAVHDNSMIQVRSKGEGDAAVASASAIAAVFRASLTKINAHLDANIDIARLEFAAKIASAASSGSLEPNTLAIAASAAPYLARDSQALARIMAPLASAMLSAVADGQLASTVYDDGSEPALSSRTDDETSASASNIVLNTITDVLTPPQLIAALCSFSASVLSLRKPTADFIICAEFESIFRTGEGIVNANANQTLHQDVNTLLRIVPILVALAGATLDASLASGRTSGHDVARLLAAHTAVSARPSKELAEAAARVSRVANTLHPTALATLTWAIAFSPSMRHKSRRSPALMRVPARYASRLVNLTTTSPLGDEAGRAKHTDVTVQSLSEALENVRACAATFSTPRPEISAILSRAEDIGALSKM
jgi:hypothetical protein